MLPTRTRTSEWRNQNPPILLEPSTLILKKNCEIRPIAYQRVSSHHEGREGPLVSSRHPKRIGDCLGVGGGVGGRGWRLVRFIAQIASRFGVVVTQKLAAQAV